MANKKPRTPLGAGNREVTQMQLRALKAKLAAVIRRVEALEAAESRRVGP